MKALPLLVSIIICSFSFQPELLYAKTTSPKSVKELLDRVCGPGTSRKIITELTANDNNEPDKFTISVKKGKPCISGNSLSALTTGIGWYLNHFANANVSWNNMHPEVNDFPLPTGTLTHQCRAEYRYYLNYCTFSYSMSTWTWERWQEEIDWMALHGINMPLQIVGLEEVWQRMLTEDFGYSPEEAAAFVAGPCFMAWFGMNNLEGWGGPNPDWWLKRQTDLGKKINGRMHELGIEPVLPGFSGMVPDNFTGKTGIKADSQGNWCGFKRPHIIDATGEGFDIVASAYYAKLEEVMGKGKYFSIDPYHEGGVAPSDPAAGYKAMHSAMREAAPGSKWVIQSWQWSPQQYLCLDNIPEGELIVLDLFSDGRPNWKAYKGHDTVYSTIFNFGGRTGFFGRLDGICNGWFDAVSNPSVKGIGAAPEAIGQTPVLYDFLFELPWMDSKPETHEWIGKYVKSRYGKEDDNAYKAWEILVKSALDCKTDLQGPHEAVMCARPSLDVRSVSTWGGTEIFYEPSDIVAAAKLMLEANLEGNNYDYDLIDIVRQTLSDKSKTLLEEIKQAYRQVDETRFDSLKNSFLQLILDTDELLSSHQGFMLGTWTSQARQIGDEATGTTEADKDWLENENARTLITTWGNETASERGGLHDYSYRQWSGMLKDFYYERWKTWFDNGMNPPSEGWYEWEHKWATDNSRKYLSEPIGSSREIASKLIRKYFP